MTAKAPELREAKGAEAEGPQADEAEPRAAAWHKVDAHEHGSSPEGLDPLVLGLDAPGSAWEIGSRVFNRELDQLILALREAPATAGLADWLWETLGKKRPLRRLRKPPAFIKLLTLDVDNVMAREAARPVPESSPVVRGVFFALCWTLDRIYEGRPVAKFWVLETVARLPYFSYITVLHLYESLGWWRTPQLREVHAAEEDNELHHLLIMESLGGGTAWFDRFAAQHAAILYYWLVVGLFVVNPSMAYNFSHLVEDHAYVTYEEFIDANWEVLRQCPPPPIATEYYLTSNKYKFDLFQTRRGTAELPNRRPPCENLLDVFSNIRDDELEHLHTMKACQEWWGGNGTSPLPSRAESDGSAARARGEWLEWSARVNALSLHESDRDV